MKSSRILPAVGSSNILIPNLACFVQILLEKALYNTNFSSTFRLSGGKYTALNLCLSMSMIVLTLKRLSVRILWYVLRVLVVLDMQELKPLPSHYLAKYMDVLK